MIQRTSSIFVIFAIIILQIQTQSPDLVVEVFRHGARGPINGTFGAQQQWGMNIGQLTGVGMRMHYLLGGALQKEYPNLLGQYNSTKIYVRSTDVDRTIMSAYSQLYGIFNQTGPNLNPNYPQLLASPPFPNSQTQTLIDAMGDTDAIQNNFQPVPIHVVQASDDELLLAMSSGCPGAESYIARNTQKQIITERFNLLNKTTSYLATQNITINSMNDLYTFGDYSICNHYQNYPLPAGITYLDQYYLDAAFAFQYVAVMNFQSEQIQNNLNAYNIWYSALGFMNATLNQTSTVTWVSYSAHDITLSAILGSMGLLNGDCLWTNYLNMSNNQNLEYPYCIYPNFAASIQFEFFLNGSNPYVQMNYNGTLLPICGGINLCPFSTFQEYVLNVTGSATPQDFINYCNPPPEPKTQSYLTLLIVLSCLCGLTFVLILYLLTTSPKKTAVYAKEPLMSPVNP